MSQEEIAADDPGPSGATKDSEQEARQPGFIEHKVSNKDTLAGIALKYNVSVSDIKRFNGLLSDTALYGRSTLQIPTRLIPLGEELQVIFAQVASGIGRDPVLNADANLHPASAAVARVARTLNIVNGDSYPADIPSDAPWWCGCGTCDEEDDGVGNCRSRRITGSSCGDVELMERSATGELMTPPSTSGGPTRMHGRVRRRRGHTGEDGDDGGTDGTDDDRPGLSRFAPGLPPRPPRHRNGMTVGAGAGSGGPSAGHTVGSLFKQLGRAIEQSTANAVSKIKAAASQPALATATGHSLGEAADGVLTSLKDGFLSRRSAGHSTGVGGGTPLLPRSFNAEGGGGGAGSTGGPLSARRPLKTGGKSD